MIIHLPTGKKFHNRKEAKIYFGTAYYYRMEREKKDLMFTNTIQSATNEYEDTSKIPAKQDCFYAVNTRMSGLIYVPSTDIDDGGKTRIGGHFFRKEFLPDVSLNSLGKWMYHTGNHFLSIIPFS